VGEGWKRGKRGWVGGGGGVGGWVGRTLGAERHAAIFSTSSLQPVCTEGRGEYSQSIMRAHRHTHAQTHAQTNLHARERARAQSVRTALTPAHARPTDSRERASAPASSMRAIIGSNGSSAMRTPAAQSRCGYI
jgi:hypothetical protein